VVTEPAHRWGVTVDEELVDLVVETAAGRDGVLPLLSTALDRAWLLRSDGRLTVAAYEEAGGVAHAVGRLADEAYESLDAEQRLRARQLLLRLVVEGPQGVARRRVPLAELDLAPTDPVLDALVARRLLTVGDEGVELVHEALFTAWPRMAAWLEEDAVGRRLRAHLSPSASAWQAGGRRPEDLYAGARLAEASTVRARDLTSLSALEQEFLDASEQHADAARSEAVARAERESRTARRLRGLLAGAVALLVLALVATLLAVQARDRARRATLTADANRLSAQALLEPRPDLSLQLAAEAVHLDPTTQTRSDLFGTLLRRQRLVRVRHDPTRFLGAQLSPDGDTLALCGIGGLMVLDARTLQRERTLPLDGSAFCTQPMFIDGGRFLATVQVRQNRAFLLVVRAADGTMVFRHRAPDGYSAFVSPDSSRLLTEGLGGSSLWVRRGTKWHELPLGTPFWATGFGMDGRLFATSPSVGRMTVRSSRDASILRRMSVPGFVVAMAAGSDVVAVQGASGQVTLLHALTGQRVGTVAGSGTNSAQAYFANHDRLFVTSNLNGEVSVWRVRSQELLETVANGAEVSSAVAPTGASLWTAGYDGTTTRWDLTGHRGFGATRPIPRGVSDAVYLDNGVVVATGSSVTSLSTALRPQGRLHLGAAISSLAPDGPHHFLVTTQRGVVVGSVRGGAAVVDRRIPLAGAIRAAVDPASGTLAATTRTGVTVFRADGRRKTWPLARGPQDVALSPGGALVAVSLGDSSSVVLDAATGDVTTRVPGTGDQAALPITFLDAGTLLVSRRAGTLVRWDLGRDRPVGDPVPAINGYPQRLQVTGDVVIVSSGGTDGALLDRRTWLRYGGGPLPAGLDGPITVLSPSGATVLSVAGDGRAVEWPFRPNEWRALACRETVSRLTSMEWREFLPGRPYDPAC
jgi:WD40 repeat protein